MKMNNEIVNTFIWEIGNFQRLAQQIPQGKSIISQRFWLPQRSFEIDHNQNCDNNTTLWEISLFPNGVEGTDKVISLYIHAIQTQYEKLNHIVKRRKQFKIGIGKYEIYGNYQLPLKSLIRKCIFPETIFDFTKSKPNWGYTEFISLNSVFPGDRSKVVNLFVQVTLIDEIEEEDDIADKSVKYEEYFDIEPFTDIEFVFDCGSKMKAHRVVLSANSTYFKNMLQGQWKEKSMNTIQIKETNYTAFRAVVYYIYSRKLMDIEDFDILKHTFKLADMMMMVNLSKLVIDELSDLIDEENWYEFFLLGWEFNSNPLKNIGLKYIAYNWERIRKSEGILRLLATNNVEGIEELFYVVNKRLEVADWNDHLSLNFI